MVYKQNGVSLGTMIHDCHCKAFCRILFRHEQSLRRKTIPCRRWNVNLPTAIPVTNLFVKHESLHSSILQLAGLT